MVTGVLPRARTGWSVYVGLSLLFVLIVAVGFWPSYFGALTTGDVDRPWFIHFHAVVYVGWLGLFVAQTLLAAKGRLRQLVSPLTDMIAFTPFFAAAVYFRRVPDLHKRLMIVSTTVLLIAAVARMRFLGGDLLVIYLVWVSPIWIGMIRDLLSRRLLHPVYVVGLVAIALEGTPTRRFIRETDVWLDITGRLAQLIA